MARPFVARLAYAAVLDAATIAARSALVVVYAARMVTDLTTCRVFGHHEHATPVPHLGYVCVRCGSHRAS